MNDISVFENLNAGFRMAMRLLKEGMESPITVRNQMDKYKEILKCVEQVKPSLDKEQEEVYHNIVEGLKATIDKVIAKEEEKLAERKEKESQKKVTNAIKKRINKDFFKKASSKGLLFSLVLTMGLPLALNGSISKINFGNDKTIEDSNDKSKKKDVNPNNDPAKNNKSAASAPASAPALESTPEPTNTVVASYSDTSNKQYDEQTSDQGYYPVIEPEVVAPGEVVVTQEVTVPVNELVELVPEEKTPLQVLEDKFKNNEITREQYDEEFRKLTGTDPVLPGDVEIDSGENNDQYDPDNYYNGMPWGDGQYLYKDGELWFALTLEEYQGVAKNEDIKSEVENLETEIVVEETVKDISQGAYSASLDNAAQEVAPEAAAQEVAPEVESSQPTTGQLQEEIKNLENERDKLQEGLQVQAEQELNSEIQGNTL